MADYGGRLAPVDSLVILRLHKNFTYLIARFCDKTLCQNPYTRISDHDPLPPSPSEMQRLLRALWRYEIYSRFFGPVLDDDLFECDMYGTKPSSLAFSDFAVAHKFFGLFPIHEMEEIACLHHYARGCYYSLGSFLKRADQLVALGPRRLHEVLTACLTEQVTLIAEGNKDGRIYTRMLMALTVYERDVSSGTLT